VHKSPNTRSNTFCNDRVCANILSVFGTIWGLHNVFWSGLKLSAQTRKYKHSVIVL